MTSLNGKVLRLSSLKKMNVNFVARVCGPEAPHPCPECIVTTHIHAYIHADIQPIPIPTLTSTPTKKDATRIIVCKLVLY